VSDVTVRTEPWQTVGAADQAEAQPTNQQQMHSLPPVGHKADGSDAMAFLITCHL
jgi:hypothetical protein